MTPSWIDAFEKVEAGKAAETYLFSEFCAFMKLLAESRGHSIKAKRIEKFFQLWRATKSDIFPVFRFLMPDVDKYRGNYNLKEKALGKIYVSVLQLSPNSADAKSLSEYTNPNAGRGAGNFAKVAELVIKKRSTVLKSRVTIADVDAQLDLLAQAVDNEARKSVISWFFNNTTAEEQQFIVRMIIKNMKLGASEQQILRIYHKDALELFNICSDIKKVAIDCYDPAKRQQTNKVELFHNFQPMLCQSTAPGEIPLKLRGREFWVQEKIDGERIQIHIDFNKKKFRYWSRNSKEWSEDYGPNPQSGSFTPYIHDAFKGQLKNVILDGEMVEYDPVDNRIVRFGTLRTAQKNADHDRTHTHPCYIAFDLLLINDESLLQQELSERYDLLRSILKPKSTWIELLPYIEGKDMQIILDELDRIYVEKGEGVVVKNPNSSYEPGTRNLNWMKFKPDSQPSVMESLDILVVGGFYGEGWRSGILSHFLLAVRDEDTGKFMSFVKVGSGYNRWQINDINQKYGPKFKKFNQNALPSWLILSRTKSERPDMYIEPEDSFVFEVAASEIIDANQFATNVSLRFPRFQNLRDDKNYLSSLTLKEVQRIRFEFNDRLQRRRLTISDLYGSKISIQKVRESKKRGQAVIPVASNFVLPDTSVIKANSALFEGIEFHVLNGSSEHPITSIINLIASYGGTNVANPGRTTWYLVTADPTHPRAKRYASSSTSNYDLIKLDYVLDSIKCRRLLPLYPKYILFATPSTKESLRDVLDPFGDSFDDDISVNSLKELFAEMDNRDYTAVDLFNSVYLNDPSSSALPIPSLSPTPAPAPMRKRKLPPQKDVQPSSRQPTVKGTDYFRASTPTNESEVTERKRKLRLIDATEEHFFASEGLPQSWFRRVVAYFDLFIEIGEKGEKRDSFCLEMAKLNFKYYGGEVSQSLDQEVTLVVVEENDTERAQLLRRHAAGKKLGYPKIVSDKWIMDCVEERTLLPVDSYIV